MIRALWGNECIKSIKAKGRRRTRGKNTRVCRCCRECVRRLTPRNWECAYTLPGSVF